MMNRCFQQNYIDIVTWLPLWWCSGERWAECPTFPVSASGGGRSSRSLQQKEGTDDSSQTESESPSNTMCILLTSARFPDLLGNEDPQLVVHLCRLSVNVLLQSCWWHVSWGLFIQKLYFHSFLASQQMFAIMELTVLLIVPVPQVLGAHSCVVLAVVGWSWGKIHLWVWATVWVVVVLVQVVDNQVGFWSSISHLHVCKVRLRTVGWESWWSSWWLRLSLAGKWKVNTFKTNSFSVSISDFVRFYKFKLKQNVQYLS